MARTRRSRRSRRSKIRSHGRRRTSRRVSRKRGRRRKSYKKRRQRGGDLDSIVSNMLTETGEDDTTIADLSDTQMKRLQEQLALDVQEPAVAYFLNALSAEREAARAARMEGAEDVVGLSLRHLLATAKAATAKAGGASGGRGRGSGGASGGPVKTIK